MATPAPEQRVPRWNRTERTARARLADVHLTRALRRPPLPRADPAVDAALPVGDDTRLGARGLGRAPPPGVGGDAQTTGLAAVSLADQARAAVLPDEERTRGRERSAGERIPEACVAGCD